MHRTRGNPLAKFAAVVLFLLTCFSTGNFGTEVMMGIPYVMVENWQETDQFGHLMRERQSGLAQRFAHEVALEIDLTYPNRQQILEAKRHLEESMDKERTWFRFQVKTADGAQVLYTNLEEGEKLSDQIRNVHYSTFILGEHQVMTSSNQPVELLPSMSDSTVGEDSLREIEADGSPLVAEDIEGMTIQVWEEKDSILVIECGVPDEIEDYIQDEFYALKQADRNHRAAFNTDMMLTLLFLGASLACLAWMLWSAGYQRGESQVFLAWYDKIYLDLYLTFMVLLGILLVFCGAYQVYYLMESLYFNDGNKEVLPIIRDWLFPLTWTALMGVVALLIRTIAVRAKMGTLIQSILICRILIGLWRMGHRLIRSLPFIWRTVALCLGYILADGYLLILMDMGEDLAIPIWFFLHILALLALIWWSVGFRKLRKGVRAIASGDMEHQIDTTHLPWDLRLQAEDLNNISVGLAGAVEEKMKSERFKAELITNVSHDLKTPLTSIINYVSLLKTTKQTDPSAQKYIEVLDRKSQRLKKLTEDLVEASKASTGVLSVNRERIGMSQLLDQALGEWEERIQSRNLTIVSTLPEGETWVYADGRHLWRVLDNLLCNCAKYAMEGTRVYIDLIRGHGQVMLLVKNISREPLNIPPERLVERFVRGDESRTTDGSGLGLSIARSLTELQGGQFTLEVDGDLFKAVVTLPQAN